MLKFIPTLKKILLFSTIGLLLFLATGMTITYVFHDKIIALFIEEANKQIKTPVKVEKIDLSIFEKFPQLTVSLENVWVQEGVQNSTEPLAKAKNIYFVLSPYELLKGNYQINQVHLEEAEVFLKIFPNGFNNYTVFEKDTSSQRDSKLGFQIKTINLKNVFLNYSDIKRDQEYAFIAEDAAARLLSQNNIYDITIDGDILSQQIRVQQQTFFKDKQLKIKTDFNYHANSDSINILPSRISVHDSDFLVEGVYHGAGENYINISATGENTDVQTILSLMSEDIYDKFKVYKSDGNVYFSSKLVGNISEDNSPELTINFGARNASLYHPDINRKIENVNLEGQFYAKKANDLSTASLRLNNVSGQMEGRSFSGNLHLQNFEDYFVSLNLDAEIDARSLLEFYPITSIKKAAGLVDVDISFEGKIKNLRNNNAAIKTSGEIILKNLQFELTSSKLPFRDFKGSFIFKNDDLAISDFSGYIGSSDFMLNGFFKNIVAYLIFEDQPITIEADLNSHLLDFDELLTGNVTENPQAQAEGEQYYSFKISPKLELAFNCNVDGLKFRRFVGQHIKGKLNVKNQRAQATDINMAAAGGVMKLDGKVDASKENFIEVSTEASFDKIHIDSIFYLFYNFNQDFLVDKHLKGQISAEVNSYMVFDNKLRFNSEKFRSDVGVTIRNGELNDFEPMQKLSKFVAEESLSRLRFSELNNIIKIQDQTIFLPPMEVKSNISTIQVRGTHTFDQKIDYYVKVPLRTFSKKDRDEAFGAIEDTGGGGANLFLTIKGTTDDYDIGYDSKAVKEKIKQDIKKEGQELKEVFQNKGRKEKEDVELNEGEYFDF